MRSQFIVGFIVFAYAYRKGDNKYFIESNGEKKKRDGVIEDAVDDDKSGTLSVDEVANLMAALSPKSRNP